MKPSINSVSGLFSAGEIVVWATVYYMFPAMLLTWEQNTGWGRTELSIGFSIALVVSAVLAPVVGKLIDSGYPGICMAGGALLGSVLLAILSIVNELLHFYLIWLGLGIVIALTHYDACFVTITRYMGEQSRTVITRITLIAGFAGMLAFPAAYYLNSRFGWQTTLQFYSLVMLLAGVPLLWFGSKHAEGFLNTQAKNSEQPTLSLAKIISNRRFWLLGIAFGLIALDHGVIISHILPILSEKQVSAGTAVLVASLIGPMQVVGRLGMVAAESRFPLVVITLSSYVVMIIAAISLLGVVAVPFLVFVFAILQGAGYGVTSILRPVVTAELLGRTQFGVISGLLTIPYMTGFAIAPTFASIVWEVGGYNLVILTITAALVTGLVAMNLAWRNDAENPPDSNRT